MSLSRISPFSADLPLAALFAMLTLTGCGAGTMAAPSAALPAGASFGETRGVAMGGEQPIGYSKLYLFSPGTAGYGSASNPLITVPDGTDARGPYITTGAAGNFALTGRYVCTVGLPVYIYIAEGNTGAGNNTAAAVAGALGICPTATTLATQLPYIVVNEATTVAFVNSLNAYITDVTHIGAPATTQGQLGLTNAFALAASLVSPASGATLGTKIFPIYGINTVANILAACVNSQGPSFPVCSSLLSTATSTGTSAGTAATDTFSAAVNIARNPTANLNTLFGLESTTPPFPLQFGSAPHDFAITIQLSMNYNGGGTTGNVAIDSQGNAWVTDSGAGFSYKFSASAGQLLTLGDASVAAVDTNDNVYLDGQAQSNGITQFTSNGTMVRYIRGNGYLGGGSIGIDGSNNLWDVNYYQNLFLRISGADGSTTTSCCSPFNNSGGSYSPTGLAIDQNGNVWSADGLAGSSSYGLAEEVNSSDMLLSPKATDGYPATGAMNGSGPSVDSADDVWMASTGSNQIFGFTGLGANFAILSGGGLKAPTFTAIDGAGHIWVADSTSFIKEYSNTGTVLSGPAGIGNSDYYQTHASLAIDPSGNVWAPAAQGSCWIFVGQATPTVTPLSVGIKNGTLGTRP